jgi:large subunit ribosomal protein L15
MQLSNLAPLVKKRKRVGRGGGRGGTSGRGHKGQGARSSGTVRPGFEGGQMPLYRRLPKRGFSNFEFKQEVIAVNLGRLDNSFNDGDVVTKETLIERGIIKPLKGTRPFAVKILNHGTLRKKLTIHAEQFSKTAMDAIEKAGGAAKLVTER